MTASVRAATNGMRRTLEWSIPSPPPIYNFATIPTVTSRDAFWVMKYGSVEASWHRRHSRVQSRRDWWTSAKSTFRCPRSTRFCSRSDLFGMSASA